MGFVEIAMSGAAAAALAAATLAVPRWLLRWRAFGAPDARSRAGRANEFLSQVITRGGVDVAFGPEAARVGRDAASDVIARCNRLEKWVSDDD